MEQKLTVNMIKEKLVELENKNAEPEFMNDVRNKAEELFNEYEETSVQFKNEQDKLLQISYLNEKVL